MKAEAAIVVTTLQTKWFQRWPASSRKPGWKTSEATGTAGACIFDDALQNRDVTFWGAHGLWHSFTAA